MVNRQYVWTEEGLRRSTANGIDFAEVASALYAPTGLRYERAYGDLLVVVMGMASTGRVVAVVCDRIGGQDVVFKIIGAPVDYDERIGRLEAAIVMSAPDLDGMTKDQIVAWLMDPANDGLKEVIRTAQRVDDGPTTSGDVPPQIPLMLTSIRLPIELVRALDDIAAVEGMSRSDVMRLAVASFVDGRQGAVSPSDALYALDVLRRVVTEHEHAHRNAA